MLVLSSWRAISEFFHDPINLKLLWWFRWFLIKTDSNCWKALVLYNSWNAFITKSVNLKVKQYFNEVLKKLKDESWNYQQSDENNHLECKNFVLSFQKQLIK
jgi:hypothetical protein